MFKSSLIVVLALLSFAVANDIERDEGVLVLTDDNFDGAIS